ncbi:hypothetical protein HBI56_152910 [Parastagonospora nodorum]|nr:hypothetical protein HBH53_154180 [Parastagonospora nodorum]KAH4014441.1 hypothetical protein HBI09_210530 [Parastagonospora nodorum]KAH4254993.1 hypothetical protein HBI03_177630 [Parastagonospora nodorum]KAH4266670.1 hypothetical protein HBI04_172640 [Parastagonospora nodorum]KAH4805672.1 hypothetical protein HBH61_154710 [Parastagonospora nodorum]
MRSTSFVAVALCAFASTAYSAPTPQLSNIIGSITNPGAGNNNKFEGIANGNGNGNGNNNEAGNNNGNNNEAGNKNGAGNGNTIKFPSLGLKERDAQPGLLDGLSGITNTIGSITNPTAGSGNSFKDIANGNGNGNGNGNSAGNGNGNGNSAGNGNQAGNGNSVSFKA